jgi:hypothetical protein
LFGRGEFDPDDAKGAACAWIEGTFEGEDGAVGGEVVAEERGGSEWVEMCYEDCGWLGGSGNGGGFFVGEFGGGG